VFGMYRNVGLKAAFASLVDVREVFLREFRGVTLIFYTLHPTPCILHPKSYTLHPAPHTHTPHPTLYTLNPTPYTLHRTPTPHTLRSTP